MTVSTEKGWWSEFFDDVYADFGLVALDSRAERDTANGVQFIHQKLQLAPGKRVFDQCCGIGRMSIPLARRGVQVIGVDQAPTYAKRAQKTADAEGLSAKYITDDAFSYVAPEACDGAFNWFTSFGYHEDDAINRRMLDRAFESLKPGGRFVLEYMSVPMVLRHFNRCHLDRYQRDGEEWWLIKEPDLDFANGMIRCRWTLMRPGRSVDIREAANRIYMPGDLIMLLQAAGFKEVEMFGAVDGRAFDMQSPRCLLVARRPD